MKGLVILFLAIALSGIGWGYLDPVSKKSIKDMVRHNLFSILAAVLAVAVAIVVSTNTTLRLL